MGFSLSTLIFQPPVVSYAHAKKHIIWLNTAKHTQIPAFYIDRKSALVILFSHGNAEDIGMIYEWFCEFTRELNVNLLAYDYNGYGKANGKPTEQGCYDCIDAAYEFLTDTMKISPNNIVLYGRSIGSGPSCYLAERLSKMNVRIGGLILQVSHSRIFMDF
jgi:abhydrolase domain-containing protein 17